jgi:CheY-like chemotaxis protein
MTIAGDAGPGTHTVQFYESEPFLHRAIERFFSPALLNDEPLVMIARRRTFESVADRLASRLDVSSFEAAGRIRFVDVDTALTGFMDGAMPDPVRLEHGLSSLIGEARRGRSEGTIWLYGEMVDVLCKDCNVAAAVRLEELWNGMTACARASVLCGYAIGDFDDDVDASHVRAVCRQHTHIVPAEDFTDSSDERVRAEQVVVLQQRARALDRLLGHGTPLATAQPGAVTAAPMIYIVDDDASVRRSLGRLLASAGLHVQSFASAEAFLAEVDTNATGCVIVDVQLIGMSGTDLQVRIAEARWPMSVIVMSASQDSQIELEAMRLGAEAFLRKPFRARVLLDAIAKTMKNPRQTEWRS